LRSGRSDRLSHQILKSVAHAAPDAVLLGGDLADQTSELDPLTELVSRLNALAPVLAIGGNHDRQIGFDRVGRAVERGGGQWIHEAVVRVKHGSRTIAVSGPETEGDAGGHVRVLCAHNPRIWKTARHAGFDLVLAGHLHGCQLVTAWYRDRLFPGALFYPYCFLSHHAGSTRLVVSRGVSDLVPIRWRCPREVVLCHV
jgi:predicted MPP superfamily phosphohydrolase